MLKEVALTALASIAKSTKVKKVYGLGLRIDYNTNLYRLGIGLELEVKLELVHMENEPNELKSNFFF